MKIKKLDLVIISVCIALLSAPLYLFRFSFFGLPLNLFLVFCFASFLILIFQTSINDFWQFVKKNQLFIFFTFLILLGGFLSLCHNGLCAKSLSIFLQWLLLPSLFSILVAIQLKKKPSHVETVLFVLFLSISLVSVIALGFALSNIFTYDGRLRGFYESPNQLAMYIMPDIFIGIYFFILSWKKMLYKLSFLYAMATGSILITLLLTKSAGAISATLLAIPLPFLFVKFNLFRYFSKLIIIFAISLLMAIPLVGSQNFISLLRIPERSSLASRIMIWESATTILKDNPFWGIGLGNFQTKYLEYQKHFPPYLEWAVPQPHNLYLAFWLETGLVGFLGFILLMMTVWKFLADQNKKKNALWAWTFLSIFASFLLYGLVDTPYWKNDLAFVFWILVAISLLSIDTTSPREKKIL